MGARRVMPRTILITGATGLIGGRLAAALAGDPGVKVVRASRRPDAAVGMQVVDWSSPMSLESLCAGVDAVVHLAAMDEAACAADPEGALLANGAASLRLLQAARRVAVSRFVYMSSIKVYGDRATGRVTEDTPAKPTSDYAITHRLAEDYLLAAHGRRELAGVVLRLSNGLGWPATAASGCWSIIGNDFCRQAASTGRIVLRSSGEQWRNFIAMADVVGALRHVLALDPALLGDGVFNLGGDEALRIVDLAGRVADCGERAFGRRPEVVRPPTAAGERHPKLDYRSDRLAATGWRPATPLETEIGELLRMCRQTSGWAAAP
jgi:UDP-glucose 4-epimerase